MYKAITTKAGLNGTTARDSDGNWARVADESAVGFEERHDLAARALCKKMGWTGTLAKGYVGDGKRVFVWVESVLAGRITTLEV